MRGFLIGLAVAAAGAAAQAQVVISQVYGGAGSTASLFNGDYVELFNPGDAPVDITGWSIQYASGAGSFGFAVLKVDLAPAAGQLVIQPHSYFLVRTYTPGPSTIGGTPLQADFTPAAPVGGAGVGVNLSQANGKIALVNTTSLLPSAPCATGDPSVVDFVGYGNTSGCGEGGTSTPPLTVSSAAFRALGGCIDTNNNAMDFGVTTPAPRNAASAVNLCNVMGPTGSGSAMPSSACREQMVTLTVTVSPGSNPPSTGITVTGNLTSITGAPAVMFADQGGGVFSTVATVGAAINFGDRSVPITIADAQGRQGLANITVTVIDCSLRMTPAADPPGVCNGEASLITAAVVPGMVPASTGITVTADLSGIGGSSTQALLDDGTMGDQTAGDNVYSFLVTVPAGTADGVASIPVSVSDAQARSAAGATTLAHAACVPGASPVVISQVYGGGGQSTALYRHDFVELFNRSDQPVDLSAYSLQYTTSGGEFTVLNVLPLQGMIQPGGYWLIQEGSGGSGGTQDLPAPDEFNVTNLGVFSGKAALVLGSAAIGSDCGSAQVVDLVSYGTGASCMEGVAAAPVLSNTTAAIRKAGGCQDTNHNGVDFVAAAPVPRNSAAPRNPCNPPTCPADFNGDGELNADDLSDYITCFFAEAMFPGSCPAAEFNGDGEINADDLSDYITAFFTGCP